MVDPPRPGRWDYATCASALAVLALAYVFYPGPAVQYGAWLFVFTLWMVWFVSFGVRWLYPETADERE